MVSDYQAFLASKTPRALATGIKPSAMPEHLFDFQAAAVDFAVRQGRAGIYYDTGLGKTRCQLEWSDQCRRAANGRALILTPLAVAKQMEREALALGYEARVIREQADARDGINICNYDRLDKLDVDAFGVVSLDESGILKNFGGKISGSLIDAFSHHRFRLSATATPAPNDHMELGQQSAFLGIMPANEMLMRWFINDTAEASQQWRLKGHAADDFWNWMASWSRMAQSPEDMGFDGGRYVLPPLNVVRHKTHGDVKPMHGELFVTEVSATNMFDLKRQTSDARADAAALVIGNEPKESWIVWCDTDDEADALKARLSDAIEVRGSQTIEQKEAGLWAFLSGQARILITKPKIAGFGVNAQHCARQLFVGRTFSYEAWYQAVRRSWRFGQSRPVNIHIIVAEGEDQIGRVIDRKAEDHAKMKTAMAKAMQRAVSRASSFTAPYNPQHQTRLPAWLTSSAA